MTGETAGDTGHLARLLAGDGVVILPTDTIYGLHVLATSEKAIARLIALKGRDSTRPFVVLGSSTGQLESIGVRFNGSTKATLEELWPGPLTVVLPLEAPIAASLGATTLAVRVPALSWLRALIETTGPLASTSVNRSGERPLMSLDELTPDLHHAVDAVRDAGRLEGEPSTIVELTGDEPRLIRKGDPLFTQKVWKRLRKSL